MKQARWHAVFLVPGVLLTLGVVGRADPPLAQSTVYQQGVDGYQGYRLPAIAVAKNGTLLAFADAKSVDIGDFSPTDLVLKRSTDNGKTWLPMQVLAHGGTSTYGSATPIVDQQTGDIIVPFLANANNVFIVRSSNNGITWSAPVDITASVKNPAWPYYAIGTGHGIQTSTGRLIVPAIHRDTFTSTLDPSYTSVIYSDDHGLTWHAGGGVTQPGTNEAQVAQLANGDLYMNMRTKISPPLRWSSVSSDGGMTWSPAQSTSLVDPSVEGSVVRYTYPTRYGHPGDSPMVQQPGMLLFANPSNPGYRRNMSVSTSYDEAATWNAPKTVYFGNSGYSDMAVSNSTVNLVYERGRTNTPGNQGLYQTITLAQFNQNFLQGNAPYTMRWDFNEQTSGPAPSTDGYIHDSGGWDLHGQALGAPTYVPGDPRTGGSALHFTGGTNSGTVLLAATDSNSFFTVGADEGFTLDTAFRTTAHGSGGQAGAGTIAYWGVGGQARWSVGVQDGKVRFYLGDGQTLDDFSSDITVNDGQWHNLEIIRTGLSHMLEMFVDNVIVGEIYDTTGALNNTGDLYIGQLAGGHYAFNGDIDYFQMVDSAPLHFLLGDMNDDGVVNNFDQVAFELAVTDPVAYLAAYPSLKDYALRADMNGDGVFNNFDLGKFEDLLQSTSTSVPEPGSFALLCSGLAVLGAVIVCRNRSRVAAR